MSITHTDLDVMFLMTEQSMVLDRGVLEGASTERAPEKNLLKP